MLLRILAPHFVAGVEIRTGGNRCAPILSYMKDWSLAKIRAYCRKKMWELEEIYAD